MTTEDFRVVAFFDGCCEPTNPGGNMGMGAIIFHEGKEVDRYSHFIPSDRMNSNNVAEYMACLWVLKRLKELKLERVIKVIRGDSNLVCEQMKGLWRIKRGLYVPYAHECRQLLQGMPNTKFEWIRREHNYFADELSKQHLIKNNIEFKIQPE